VTVRGALDHRTVEVEAEVDVVVTGTASSVMILRGHPGGIMSATAGLVVATG
jgi:hypothetical protein